MNGPPRAMTVRAAQRERNSFMNPETNNAVTFDSSDGIATITLNRPPALNALNADMVKALADAVNAAASDESPCRGHHRRGRPLHGRRRHQMVQGTIDAEPDKAVIKTRIRGLHPSGPRHRHRHAHHAEADRGRDPGRLRRVRGQPCLGLRPRDRRRRRLSSPSPTAISGSAPTAARPTRCRARSA